MSVREAQERIDSREFGEWLAFDSIAPIGQARMDYDLAGVAYHIVNALVEKHVPYDQFLVFNRPEPKLPSEDQLTAKLMVFKRFFESHGKGKAHG